MITPMGVVVLSAIGTVAGTALGWMSRGDWDASKREATRVALGGMSRGDWDASKREATLPGAAVSNPHGAAQGEDDPLAKARIEYCPLCGERASIGHRC